MMLRIMFVLASVVALAVVSSLGVAAEPAATRAETDIAQPQSPPLPIPAGMKFIDQGKFDPRLKGYFTPDGFKVEIVADAPTVINPVGLSFAADGTLFVLEWTPDTNTWPETLETITYKDGSKRTVVTMKKKVKDYIKVLTYNAEKKIYDQSRIILDDELPSSILLHDGYLYTASRSTVRRWKLSEVLDGKHRDAKPEIIAQGFCGFHHHQVSGLTIGNDGWLYITSGDDDNYAEGSDGSRATVLRTGAVFRCRPDGSKLEVYSIGYRNPYRDLVYDDAANWFHVDNDNEDGSKFTGCRLMHVAEESDFGWRLFVGARCCRPDPVRGSVYGELPGKMPPMLKTGRGSPAGLLIYGDTQLPAFYRGWLYYPDVFRKLIRAYKTEPSGSTFKVTHEFEFLRSEDPLFRPCQMVTGPDGAIYICDWRTDSGGAGKLFGDGKNGRIYRVTWVGGSVPGEPEAVPAIEAKREIPWNSIGPKSSADELLTALRSPDFTVRKLAQLECFRRSRSNPDEVRTLLRKAIDPEEPNATRVTAIGGLNCVWNDEIRKEVLALLGDKSADVRRLAADTLALNAVNNDREIHAALLKALSDNSLSVRRAVVLAIGKLNVENAAEVLVNAYKFDDEKCIYLTDGILRAIERTGKAGVHRLLELARSGNDAEREKVVVAFLGLRTKAAADSIAELLGDPHINPTQRAALIRSYTNYQFDPPLALDSLLDFLLTRVKEPMEVQVAAIGVLADTGNLKGAKVSNVLTSLLDSTETTARLTAIQAIEKGMIGEAVPRLVQVLADGKRPVDERIAIVKALRTLKDKSGLKVLGEILGGQEAATLRAEALRTIATLDPATAQSIALKYLEVTEPLLQTEAVVVLGANADGAKRVAQSYLDKKLPRDLLPQVSESLRKHADKNPELKQMLTEVMKGGLLVSLEPGQIEKVRQLVLTRGSAQRGKLLYLNSKQLACVTCHKLEGLGGQVGPDLTKLWETASIEKLMESIIDPSKEIKEGFQSFRATTKGGQTYVGLKVIDKPEEIVIREATGKDIRIPREDLEQLVVSKVSLMPDNVVSQLSFDQFLDLVAFLKSKDAQESLRGSVNQFWVVGPFGPDLTTGCEPEKNPDPKAVYSNDLRWQLQNAEPNGYLNLRTTFNKDNSSAYALTYVISPMNQRVTLFLGSDDVHRLWVNGKLLHEVTRKRLAAPEQDRVEVDLPAGKNVLLFKVASSSRQQGLFLRLEGNGLRATTQP